MNHWPWVFSMLVLPVIMPIMGLTIARFFPIDETRYAKRLGILSQFRDGQLGWVAVSWSIGTIYEIWHQTGSRTSYWNLFECVAFLAIFAGTVISAGGAIEAKPDTRPRRRFILLSLVIATASAMTFYTAHVSIEQSAEAGVPCLGES